MIQNAVSLPLCTLSLHHTLTIFQDSVVSDPKVSNYHFLVFPEATDKGLVAVITDMSSNGTSVNGILLGRNRQRILKDQDEISITSSHRYIFRYPGGLRTRQGDFSQEYTLISKLGKGQFAEVYLCEKKATGTKYAVKIFERHGESGENWDTETAILMSLSHPNVQHTKASFVEPGRVYIVMEYANGGELFHHIVSKQRLSEDETRTVFRQLLKGVEYLVSDFHAVDKKGESG